MGYRISYENGEIRKKTLVERRIKWKSWGTGVAVIALAVTMLVPQGRLWLRDLILPGNEDVTAAALEGMVADLRSGAPMADAWESLCREILAGAE